MTKDSTELEYKGEIYGRIWEAITWDKEEREYQHLTNALFMAAKEDIIAEKDSMKGSTKKAQDNVEAQKTRDAYFTENLDKVITEFCKEIPDERRAEAQSELKKDLLLAYIALKGRLKEVRVLGVGNSSLEAAGKACKICLKTMIVAVCSVANALNLASLAAPPAVPVTVAITSAAVSSASALPFATIDSGILKIVRENMKNALKLSKITEAVNKKTEERKLDSGLKGQNLQNAR